MYNANRLQGAPNDAADVEETADTTFVHEFFGHAFVWAVHPKLGGYEEKETGYIKPQYVGNPPWKSGYPQGEEEGLTAENRYRIDHGLPIRTYYLLHPGEWVYPEWIKPFIAQQEARNKQRRLQEFLRSEERRRQQLEHNIWNAPGLR